MNIQGIFAALVHMGATWVLWLLVLLSVLAVSVILERVVFFWTTKVDVETIRAQLNRAISQEDLRSVRRRLDESPSVEARIVAATIECQSPAEAEERMAAESQLQRLRSEKNLAFLGPLGNNAPFIGLLGTVVGIIGAFAELDASAGRLTTGLMAEIGEALVATAVGLLVALPAVAAFNLFQRAITIRLAQGDALARQFVAHLHTESHLGKTAQVSSRLAEARSREAS
jgi:biopolymer transport protein ExbB